MKKIGLNLLIAVTTAATSGSYLSAALSTNVAKLHDEIQDTGGLNLTGVIKALNQVKAENINERDDEGQTALHHAVENDMNRKRTAATLTKLIPSSF